MTGLAKEYGDGLYELARDEGLREVIHGDLMTIRDCLKAQPEFVRLLCSRALERSERLRVVDDTFSGRTHAYIVNYMKLLVERERFDAFLESVQWFHTRYNDDFGIVEASVTTAVALPEDRLEALRAKLREISGKEIALQLNVDPTLIGGIRVEMDGRRYDNSIQNRLNRLKRSLTENL